MINSHSFKFFATAFILFGTSLLAVAQKVQNVQETSVWAIAPVKIDGKTSDDSFQAYNKSTSLFYTLSNDDKNIYLVVKSTDAANNNKIMMGGVTFVVNTSGKKKEKEGVSITYPVIARPQRGQGGFGGGFQMPQGGGQPTTGASADSAAAARRKQQLAIVKEIKVFGIKDIPDSLISIYNEFGIVAVANFDDKGTYVYELAVPLNLLGLTSASKDFAYNIKINGLQFGGFGGGGNRPAVAMGGGGGGRQGGGGGFGGGGFGGGQGGGGRGGFDPSIFLPTDFWGKYTLAKNN